MGVISKQTMEVYFYTDSNGKKQPLKEMSNEHLLNALLFAERSLSQGEYRDELEQEDVNIMKGEVLMRMRYGDD